MFREDDLVIAVNGAIDEAVSDENGNPWQIDGYVFRVLFENEATVVVIPREYPPEYAAACKAHGYSMSVEMELAKEKLALLEPPAGRWVSPKRRLPDPEKHEYQIVFGITITQYGGQGFGWFNMIGGVWQPCEPNWWLDMELPAGIAKHANR